MYQTQYYFQSTLDSADDSIGLDVEVKVSSAYFKNVTSNSITVFSKLFHMSFSHRAKSTTTSPFCC